MSGVYIELARELAARLRAAERDTAPTPVIRLDEQPPPRVALVALR